MEGRSTARLVILLVIANLALLTAIPHLREKMSSPHGSEVPSSNEPTASSSETMPASFTVVGALSGSSADQGFKLPNSTVIRVRGTAASGKGERQVSQLLGVDRLTGEETFVFNGRVDRRTGKLSGTVTWTLRARAGDRFTDWRFRGTLSATFADRERLKGTVSGTATETNRYGSWGAAPTTSRRRVTWTYTGVRG